VAKFFISTLLLVCSVSFADVFVDGATYQVCFTPQENCVLPIVTAIDNAKQQILVQAYSFNQRDIIHALLAAQQRGVIVKILLDKDALNHSGLLRYLKLKHVDFKIDALPAIAHNKVMIIDANTIITGSFNFTFAAAHANAENVLIIQDPKLAQKYLRNWHEREKQAQIWVPGIAILYDEMA